MKCVAHPNLQHRLNRQDGPAVRLPPTLKPLDCGLSHRPEKTMWPGQRHRRTPLAQQLPRRQFLTQRASHGSFEMDSRRSVSRSSQPSSPEPQLSGQPGCRFSTITESSVLSGPGLGRKRCLEVCLPFVCHRPNDRRNQRPLREVYGAPTCPGAPSAGSPTRSSRRSRACSNRAPGRIFAVLGQAFPGSASIYRPGRRRRRACPR